MKQTRTAQYREHAQCGHCGVLLVDTPDADQHYETCRIAIRTAALRAEDLVPVRGAGTRSLRKTLRKCGLVLRRSQIQGQSLPTKHTWWAPRWAVLAICFGDVPHELREAAVRRAARDDVFCAALQAVVATAQPLPHETFDVLSVFLRAQFEVTA